MSTTTTKAATSSLEALISGKLLANDKRLRKKGVEWCGIVIHHTGLPSSTPKDDAGWKNFQRNTAHWLTKQDDAYVSAHFQIGRFGEILQLVDPDTHEAFHAGLSAFWHPGKREWLEDWNRYGIGIELLGDGNREAYSDAQYEALAKLCRALMERYPSIQPQAIVGHEQIAPGRKTDPGRLFDWRRFFGLLFKT